MNSKQSFKSTAHSSLCSEIIRRSLAIQQALNKYDRLLDGVTFEEWKELRSRFWNIYVYPKLEIVYFEIFPDELDRKDDPDRFKGEFEMLDYNQKMAVALCTWLKRDGFFHVFEGEVFFINLDASDLAFVMTDGVPFRRYPQYYIVTLLERMTIDSVKKKAQLRKLFAWLLGLVVVIAILVWTLIINLTHY